MVTIQEAKQTVESLYGMQEPFLRQLIEDMGISALSDQAIIRLAEAHLAAEEEKGRHLDRVAEYKKSHPFLSWNECEQNLRLGLR